MWTECKFNIIYIQSTILRIDLRAKNFESSSIHERTK